MQTIKLFGVLLFCACLVLINGCAELDDLKIQNATQRKRIAKLDSELQAAELKIEQSKRELGDAESHKNIEVGSLNQQIAALEEDVGKKKALIASMQQQLLYGGLSLPVELSVMLEDFAKAEEIVTYDSNRGIVKFKSDLLFKRGSDKVAPSAAKAVKSLCEILNSEHGKKFDVIIAGHTDDMRITRPATREKHPSNWHLSAHRAISVLELMTKNNIASERTSIRGFGEFRPIEPNKPNKRGNPKNRRVEIYIVAKGV